MPESASSRGHLCEELTERHYRQKGYAVLARRWRTRVAEVDLVLRSPKGILTLVEVKSSTSPNHRAHRLSRIQYLRLARVVDWLAQLHRQVELHLALVDGNGNIEVLPDLSSCFEGHWE